MFIFYSLILMIVTPNPCQNGGTSTDIFNRYYCTCAAGYIGRNCSEGNKLKFMTLQHFNALEILERRQRHIFELIS